MKRHIPPENFLSSGDYLAVVRDFALSKGITTQDLLKDSDISLNDLINPPKLMNNFFVRHLGENLYNALSNHITEAAEFGLSMTASTHGSLGVAVQCAPNLREAYKILSAFYNTRINSQNIQMEEAGEVMRVTLVNKFSSEDWGPNIQQFFDFATLISIATNTYRALDNSKINGNIQLHIDAEVSKDFPFERLIGVDVVFNQPRLEILMPLSWMNAPLNIANPDLARAAVEKCESELKLLSPSDLLSKVNARLADAENELPTLDEMAQECFMSAATFKRKLKEQDTNYQSLKDLARLERATNLLSSTQTSIEDIASLLGFSDASNFTKAFKGWTGQTPKAYRSDHKI